MAERPSETKIKPAIELIIEVPTGIERPQTDQLIQAALRLVPTDALEDEQKVILSVQHNQTPKIPPPPTPPPPPKKPPTG